MQTQREEVNSLFLDLFREGSSFLTLFFIAENIIMIIDKGQCLMFNGLLVLKLNFILKN